MRNLFLKSNTDSHVESILGDIFIANMLDGQFHRELLKKTITPKKALGLVVNIEMEVQN